MQPSTCGQHRANELAGTCAMHAQAPVIFNPALDIRRKATTIILQKLKFKEQGVDNLQSNVHVKSFLEQTIIKDSDINFEKFCSVLNNIRIDLSYF